MTRAPYTLDLFAAAATIARPIVTRREQHVRERSRAAREVALPQLARRAAAILAWLAAHGPATDREVMRGLGFVEPNAVRPRISELIDAGLGDKRLMYRIRTKRASELLEGALRAAAYYARGGGKVFAEGMLNVLNKGLHHKFTMGEALEE